MRCRTCASLILSEHWQSPAVNKVGRLYPFECSLLSFTGVATTVLCCSSMSRSLSRCPLELRHRHYHVMDRSRWADRSHQIRHFIGVVFASAAPVDPSFHRIIPQTGNVVLTSCSVDICLNADCTAVAHLTSRSVLHIRCMMIRETHQAL